MKRAALIATAALLCLAAAAQPDPRAAKFLASLQLAPDAKVQYLDENGRAIGLDAFLALVNKGRMFDFEHQGRTSATLRLKPPQAARSAGERSATYKLHAGDAFPAFALQSVSGTRVSAANLRGKNTLVNFFFAECSPCIAEIPVMNAYARAHPEVQVLAVTFDDAKTGKDFAKQRHLQWPILVEGMGLVGAAGVTAFPSFVLVGPDGRVRAIAPSAAIAGKQRTLEVPALSTWVVQHSR